MADVTIEVGGHSYTVACRDGEEAHLRHIAAHVDAKAGDVRKAVGGANEVRQLLLASLLLADELEEARKNGGSAPVTAPSPTASTRDEVSGVIADAAEQLASRIEALATRLEKLTENA
jgi:cell division protein ZapA